VPRLVRHGSGLSFFGRFPPSSRKLLLWPFVPFGSPTGAFLETGLKCPNSSTSAGTLCQWILPVTSAYPSQNLWPFRLAPTLLLLQNTVRKSTAG
jgi:hypothetical protein